MQIKVKSAWAEEVNFGEIFDEMDEFKLTNFAHAAINNFYRKEKKRRVSGRKPKPCWQ